MSFTYLEFGEIRFLFGIATMAIEGAGMIAWTILFLLFLSCIRYSLFRRPAALDHVT